MKTLHILLSVLLFGLVSCGQDKTDEETITAMLHEFLAGASVNDIEIHDRFWADDLIYTGSAGTRVSKADILESLRENEGSETDPEFVYSAEDIRIQLYGTTAILAFRLVANSTTDDSIMQFYNTGTLLRRDGNWQVVSWQATRIPEPN